MSTEELAAEKWEPFMNQGMILAYIAFCVGLILAILTFLIELLLGKKKQGLQKRLLKHQNVPIIHAWPDELDKGVKEPSTLKK